MTQPQDVVTLQRRVVAHRELILAAIERGVSNGFVGLKRTPSAVLPRAREISNHLP